LKGYHNVLKLNGKWCFEEKKHGVEFSERFRYGIFQRYSVVLSQVLLERHSFTVWHTASFMELPKSMNGAKRLHHIIRYQASGFSDFLTEFEIERENNAYT
jgi:hypothetical protein